MERSVHLFAYLRIPYEAVRDVLWMDPGRVLRPAWEEATGVRAASEGPPRLEVHGLEDEDGGARRCRVHFSCSGRELSVLSAGIEVSELSPGETRVALLCWHRPSLDDAAPEPDRQAREALQRLFMGSVRRLEAILRPDGAAGNPVEAGVRA